MRRLASVLLVALLSSGTISACAGLGSKSTALEDAWVAYGSSITGGATAKPNHIYTVRTRRELIAALNDGVYPARSAPSNEAKIIHVEGVIDVNVDDDNRALTCNDYVRDGYNIEAFVAAYDPATWGREPPKGVVEAARIKSHDAQEERVRIRMGSNTTLIGKAAALKGAWLDIQRQSNIIVRNIAFADTHDCFPAWEPKDGQGAWNSEYDFISIRASDYVWIDHNSFDDGVTADSIQPYYFGKHFQVHDGAVDVTEGADRVTISWNRFSNHDKVMLIGSSDSRVADRGKLRVTLHHNLFENVGQRTPRVRYGQVHVYNNLYRVGDAKRYQYSWGVGTESGIYAQNNAIVSTVPFEPSRIAYALKGTALHATGTLLNNVEVDVVAAFNAKRDPDLSRDVGWQPALHTKIDAARDVEALVGVGVGAGPFATRAR